MIKDYIKELLPKMNLTVEQTKHAKKLIERLNPPKFNFPILLKRGY